MANCNVDLWTPYFEAQNRSVVEWTHKGKINSAEALSKWSKEQCERISERMKAAMKPLNSINLNTGVFFKIQSDLKIKNVIFNPPATIVFWNDGTKTVSKTHHGDKYDAEKGLAMAVMRKVLNNKDYHEHLIKAEDYQGILDALNSLLER